MSAVAGAVKVVAAVVVGAAAAGGFALASAEDAVATVTKVVDGDTIDVRHDGEVHRVRLLNIDAPESVDPDEPVACMGLVASRFLRDRLPVGTEVRLEYDEERLDRYDRELAGVFLGESLLNAEIAREGLGVAMSIEPNTKFYAQVAAAQQEAEAAGRGLYSEDSACTLPAQAQQLEATTETVAAAAPVAGAGLEAFDAHGAALVAAGGTAAALEKLLSGDGELFPLAPFDADAVERLRKRVDATADRISDAKRSNADGRAAEAARLDAERVAAEEAARLAAEEAAAQAAAQAAASQRSGSGSSSGSTTPRSSGTSSSIGSGATSSAPSGGGDTYTGCRAYGPGGTSIDDKGRRYTKIDCTTKQPIG